MSWNERVVKKRDDNVVTFGVHEVFYDDNGVPDGIRGAARMYRAVCSRTR